MSLDLYTVLRQTGSKAIRYIQSDSVPLLLLHTQQELNAENRCLFVYETGLTTIIWLQIIRNLS